MSHRFGLLGIILRWWQLDDTKIWSFELDDVFLGGFG
jgi:hypothetical protein